MSKEKPGCQHAAGVLEDGKLATPVYDQIVQNIIDAGDKGFAAVHPELPCAESLGIGSALGLVPKDLHDKAKYPDFHNNVMGDFEKIALALDVEGQFSLPYPLWDPFAIGLKLGLNVSFDLPDLPTITPPSLAIALGLKIPDLYKVIELGIPQIPIPDFSIYLPKLNIDLLPDLSIFLGWPLKLPDFVLGLAVPDINFVMKLLSVPPDPCPIIKKAIDKQLFGPAKPTDLTKIIATAEKITFTSKASMVTVASLLVGNGGKSGITGKLGENLKFRKAEVPSTNDWHANKRKVVIEAFKQEFNREPYLKEAQFVQIIALIENGYGTVWTSPKGQKEPPQAKQSNNWGNIHGKGDVGSFSWLDYDNGGKPYGTPYAMYSSPVAGCRALVRHLFKMRSYIHEAILNDKSLYKPVYLMSSRAVLGSGSKLIPPKVTPDAEIPPEKGGFTFYEAPPEIYLTNFKSGLKTVMKEIGETTDFDLEAKSGVPYSEDDAKGVNNGTASVASSDQEDEYYN